MPLFVRKDNPMWKQIMRILIPSVIHALAALLDCWADRQNQRMRTVESKGGIIDEPDVERPASPAYHYRSPGSDSAPLRGDCREEP